MTRPAPKMHKTYGCHVLALQEWLWCETWCGNHSKAAAKTIDLCNNPLTKEPKLTGARRIVAEWPALDAEVAAFTAKVLFCCSDATLGGSDVVPWLDVLWVPMSSILTTHDHVLVLCCVSCVCLAHCEPVCMWHCAAMLRNRPQFWQTTVKCAAKAWELAGRK